jgi:hypothetical protein
MSNVGISVDLKELLLKAGDYFKAALELTTEDARAGLKYHLLRLSLLGLSDQDQKQLCELTEQDFRDQDVTSAADQIKRRKTASPLAVVMAELIATAEDKRMAVLGARLRRLCRIEFQR